MMPRPLCQIRLRWRDHRSALWWLGLLYRRPAQFRGALETCSMPHKLISASCLWLHSLPYVLSLSVIGRYLVFGSAAGITVGIAGGIAGGIAVGIAGGIAVGIAAGIAAGIAGGIAVGIAYGTAYGIAYGIIPGSAAGIASGIAFGIATGIATGIIYGIAGGIAVGFAVGIAFGIAAGTASGIAYGIAIGTTYGFAVGIAGGIAFGIAFGIGVGIASRIAGGIGIGIAIGIGGGIASGIAVGITYGIGVGIGVGIAFGFAFGFAVSRCYYHIAHPFFVWPRARGHWYVYHPVAWDDCCLIPFPDLDRLLVAYAEQAPDAGATEIDRLIDNYPGQRRAALRARTRVLAREAGRVSDLTRLSAIAANLPEGEGGFLGKTRRIRESVEEITSLQAQLAAADRTFLREPYAALLCTTIENFRSRVSGFHEPLRSEFRAAAANWLQIAERQLHEIRPVPERERTPQVFRAGDPVDREREAFVPRYGVVGELEQQVMLSTGCPGIVLYGRRRMGKSTALRNLSRFLPPRVQPVIVSMQEAEAFTSLSSLVGLIGARLRATCSDGGLPDGASRDLVGLSGFLSACNDKLGREGRRLIIALDEYEHIDLKIGDGTFPEDLLATLRESMQVHRNLTWVFAGSHEITELGHAPWASYLISARTIEVPPFSEAETRLLLTEPLRYSSLWPQDQPRPSFPAAFWGEGGIERIHAEAGGWPHLVQLIAGVLVDLANADPGRPIGPELFERALGEAIVRGDIVLYQLVRGECRLPGEWEYLSAFRQHEVQPPPKDEDVARSLRRRLLVAIDGDQWRLRVPLMRRWIRERG